MKQKIGIVGLGKMGHNMSLNLLTKNYQIYGYDINEQNCEHAKKIGVETVCSLQKLIKQLLHPRIIILSTPAGETTNNLILELSEILETKDVVIDTTNAHYQSSQKNNVLLEAKKIYYLDCGLSGGSEGAKSEACMMIGGQRKYF